MPGADRPSLHSPETLRELVTRLREGIYVTNRAGDILDANPAFLEMLGVASLAELAEYSAEKLVVDPEARRREREILERDGVVRDFELTLRRPDGERRTVLDTAYALERSDDDAVYVGMLIDITRRTELERELREQAVRDALTGCFNRRYLRMLADEVEAGDARWGAVIVDIDHFKRINDELGHQAGDEILIRMGRFLMCEVRAKDAVIRYGGDEFVLFLRGADEEETSVVGARLRAEAPRSAPVPFSLGWATRRDNEPLERTVGRADRELLQVRFEARGFPATRRSG
ncbi:MAG: sensor domain-containing diguanylate cyclase [Thermoanaerobaculales bacterium]|jgi:diguanylate cyclase (GGDEF)-like protein/PAS domain S-box-containing protein|nr:sensor domain-containing diguanylate cyclase [Thermoanaerobaculales bacterium]